MSVGVVSRLGSRRSDLDWLRVLVILSVFVYHSGRFFDLGEWSVKNPVTYPEVSQFLSFMTEWMMPVIFVISGASVFLSMGKGGPRTYVWTRTLRLLVPLVVAVFTHAALQVYLERVSHGQFQGSFIDFIPRYFDGLYFEQGDGNFAFAGMHLWYLLVLFVFSLLLMPLFFGLKRRFGQRVLRGAGDFLSLPGAVILLAVPTILLQNFLDRGSVLGSLVIGGWTLPHYLWFFIAGYLIISSERVQQRVGQSRWIFLALGVIVTARSLLTTGSMGLHPDLTSWCWILAILGFGMKHLTSRTTFLSYANEAVLPFYILHQTVLLWIGFFVIQWAIPDLAKYLIIASSSFVVIVLVYEFAVRRNKLLRFLFGMHPVIRAIQPARPALSQL